MKKIGLLIVSLLLIIGTPNVLKAQSEDNDNKLYTEVHEAPEYDGGSLGISQFIGTNLQFPKQAIKNNVSGQVVATFVIEKDGSISDVTIVQSLTPECDQAVVDVINKMSKWTPGRMNGKAVRVQYTLPITFKFDDGSIPGHPLAK